MFLLSSALVFVLGETTARWMAPKSDPVKLGLKLPNSARRYGLKPNVRSLQAGVQVAINSLGFRERDYPLAKAAGVRRIVVLGDSYTLGVGVEFSEIFSKRLEARLNQAGGPFQVINFGISGYNTVLELATFREVAAAFRPDLVVVAYVLNDAERKAGSDEEAQGHDAQSLVTAIHLGLKEKSMLYRYLSPKIGRLFEPFNARYSVGSTQQIIRSFDDSSLGWLESRRALLEIVREARTIEAEAVVVVFPMMLDFRTYPLGDAHGRISRFCRENGIEVLDLLPRFVDEDVGALTVFLDGHPNSQAHKIFADEIFEYLRRTFPELRSSPSRPAGT